MVVWAVASVPVSTSSNNETRIFCGASAGLNATRPSNRRQKREKFPTATFLAETLREFWARAQGMRGGFGRTARGRENISAGMRLGKSSAFQDLGQALRKHAAQT